MATKNKNRKVLQEKKSRSQNLVYFRILEIDKNISLGKFPNSVSLADQLEVSKLTIKRDIEYMRDLFNAPILYDKKNNGYYYENTTFRLPAMFATEDEINSGAIALKLLSQYKTTPIYKHLENIFNIFYKVLSNKKIKNKSWIDNRVVFIDEVVPEFDKNIWSTVVKSVIENRYITFSYKRVYQNNIGENYHIAPYQLICKAGVWYLAGYSNNKKSVALYAIHRIFSVHITDEYFEMDKNYKYYKTTNRLFGVHGFEKSVKCKIQFFNESANYISERIWVDDQKIIEKKDGSIIMSFSSGQLYDILRFILQQGANAIPLAPTQLVDSWKKEIKNMYKNTKNI